MKGDILGFSISPMETDGIYKGGEWQGKFAHWAEKNMGASITTFKREKYVKRQWRRCSLSRKIMTGSMCWW